MRIQCILLKVALKLPLLRRKSELWYKMIGVNYIGGGKLARLYSPEIIGEYSNIILHPNAEVNSRCFLLAKDKIEIGENSKLAYGVAILASTNSNGPLNRLSLIYPEKTAFVIIGRNV